MVAQLLTAKQAAQFLNMKENTLYSKGLRREIPRYKLGRNVRFKMEDLERYLEMSRVEALKQT